MPNNTVMHADYTELKDIQVQDMEKPMQESRSIMPSAVMESPYLEELKTMFEKCDLFERHESYRTPLHQACGLPQQKFALVLATVILKRYEAQAASENIEAIEHFVDCQDANGDTALHIAARLGHQEVVKLLTNSGADYNISNNEKVEQIELIYQKVPYHMTSMYDASVEYSVGNSKMLTFDFGRICGVSPPDPNKPPVFHCEMKWLSLCLGLSLKKQKVILMHPVVQLFLHLKWKKIKVLLWLSILYHILWLTFYTYFNVNLYMVMCPYHSQAMPNSTDTKIHCDAWNQHSRLVVEISILLLMTISILLKEVYELYHIHSRKFKLYFKETENIGQWLVLGIVVLISITIFLADEDENKINLPEWQYQVSAFGILLSCFLCTCQIGKIPKFGIYMLILAKVVKGFVMFIITFAVILVAFMLSLQILMPEKDEFNDNPWSFIRLLSMMSGEINYDSLFHDQPDDFQLPFPISTKLLFAVFIAIVTLILCNLLIGLTVSDIQSLQSDAALHSLSIQVEGMYMMESFFMSHSVQALFRKLGKHRWLRYFLVTPQRVDNNLYTAMKHGVHIDEIPHYLQSKLIRRAAENSYKYDTTESVQNVEKVRSQINAILDAFIRSSSNPAQQ